MGFSPRSTLPANLPVSERLAAGDDDVVEPGTGDFGEQRVQRRLTATVDAHEYFVSHQAHPTEQP